MADLAISRLMANAILTVMRFSAVHRVYSSQSSFIGSWCNGSINGSNPFGVGSNPTESVLER